LQKGMEKMENGAKEKRGYSLKNFAKDIVLSIVYSILIVILVKLGMIKPIL